MNFDRQIDAEAAEHHQNEILGSFSSHPNSLRTIASKLSSILTIVVLGVFFLSIYVWLRSQDASDLLQAVWSFLTGTRGAYAIGVGGFLLAANTSMALYVRWLLHVNQRDRSRTGQAIEQIRINPWAFGLVLGLMFVLPPLLIFLPSIPFEFRLLGGIIGVFPLVGMSWFLKTNDEEVGFPIIALLTLLVVGYVAMAGSDLYDWASTHIVPKLANEFPALLSESQTNAVLRLVITFAAVFFLIKLTSWIYFGGVKRLRNAIQKLWSRLRGKGSDEASVSEATSEEVHSELIAAISAAGLALSESYLVELAEEQTHPLVQASQWRLLFNGLDPTTSQDAVVQQFWELSTRQFPVTSGMSRLGTELLIEGPPGSGKTIALDVMAIVSALMLGRPAVYLTPDSVLGGLCIDRLQGAIEQTGLSGLITVNGAESCRDELGKGLVDALPDILVLTVGEWEDIGFNSRNSEDVGDRYSTVLLDGWEEFPADVRASLNFLLAEFRLNQDVRGNLWSTTITTSELTDVGKRQFYKGMFSSYTAVNIHSLRPPTQAPAKVYDLESHHEDLDSILRRLQPVAAAQQFKVVALRPDLGRRTAESLTESLSGANECGIEVCASPQRWDYDSPGLTRAILALLKPWQMVLSVIPNQPSESSTSTFIIRLASIKPSLAFPKPITPLIADVGATSLARRYQDRVTSRLPENSPSSAEAWVPLGFNLADRGIKTGELSTVLVIDNPSEAQDITESFDRTFVRDASITPADFADLFDATALVELPMRPAPTELDYGLMQWVRNLRDGQVVAVSYIHRMTRVVLESSGSCVDKIVKSTGGGAQVVMAHFEDAHTNPIYPKHELRVAPESQNTSLGAEPVLGGGTLGFEWIQYPKDQNCWVHGVLKRIVREDGEGIQADIDYKYLANVTLIDCHISGNESTTKGHDESPTTLWNTLGDDYLPVTSWALFMAIERQLYGADGFGRAAVFWTPNPNPKLTIVLIEPVELGNTLSNALLGVIKDSKFARELLQDWASIGQELQRGNEGYAASRFWSDQVAKPGDCNEADTSALRLLVEHVQSLEDEI